MLICFLTIVAKGGGVIKRRKGKDGREKKNGNAGQIKAVSLVRSGEDDKCLDTRLWARGIFFRQDSETDSCSVGQQHCTNLHILFSLQRSLGLIASDSRQ